MKHWLFAVLALLFLLLIFLFNNNNRYLYITSLLWVYPVVYVSLRRKIWYQTIVSILLCILPFMFCEFNKKRKDLMSTKKGYYENNRKEDSADSVR
jgi:phosphotransferase system  glucose/maltose/N-acetylglucosamine-specific IIC component